MRQYVALGAIMLMVGLMVGLYAPAAATACAWGTAGMLAVFGLVHDRAHASEKAGSDRGGEV
jgi:hypothetical protein